MAGTLFYKPDKAQYNKIAPAINTIEYLAKHGIKINDSASDFYENWKTQTKYFKDVYSKNNKYCDVYPYELLTSFILKKYKLSKENLATLKIIANNVVNIFKESSPSVLRPYAKKLLKKLSKKYKLGIISNTLSVDAVIRKLYEANIMKYFDRHCVYLSCVSNMRKPNPDIFLSACIDLNVKPTETVFVGDTISRDVTGSRNAKLNACIRFDNEHVKEADKNDTQYIITSFKQFIKTLKTIENENL